MTPWERFAAAMSFETPDQVPVVFCMTSNYYSWFGGIKESEFYTSPELMLKCEMAAQERWPDMILLPGFGPDFSIQFEPRAFGAQVKQPPDAPPMPLAMIKNIEDVEKMAVPDPGESGLCPKCMEYYRWMKEHTTKEFREKYGYLDGWQFYVLGPFDTSLLLRGATEFMTDIYMHPQLIKKLIDIVTQWEIEWLKLQEEGPVGRFKLMGVYDDNSGNISRKHFQEFAFPYFKRIYDTFRRVPFRLFHNDAKVHHIMDLFYEMGVNNLVLFDAETDIGVFKERIGKNVCLTGNVKPLEVLLRDTTQEVERECKRQIEVGKEGSGYVLAPGGAISRGTPEANLDMMIRAAEKYGKY